MVDRLRTGAGTPQDCTQAGLEFGELEWLDDVIVGTPMEAGDPVFKPVASRDDNRRDVGRGPAAQLAEHMHPIGIWQAQIQDDGVVSSHAAGGQSLVSPPN